MASITLRPISGSGSNWSNIGNAYDGNESTNASVSVSIFNYSSRILTLNFDTSVIPSGVTINSATLTMRSKAGRTTITAYVDINGNSEYRVINQQQSTKATNYTANIADYISDLQNVVVTVNNSNWSGNTFDLYEIWIDVDYTVGTTYTVTFKDYDGRIISSYNAPLTSMFTVPNDPVRDGYIFSYWSNAELGEFTKSQLEERTPELLGANGDVEFTAVYNKIYTVRFLDWNENVLDIQTVEEGNSATPPTLNPRDGYTFVGWLNPDNYKYVTKDLIVRSMYTANEFGKVQNIVFTQSRSIENEQIIDKNDPTFYVGLDLYRVLPGKSFTVDLPAAKYVGWAYAKQDGSIYTKDVTNGWYETNTSDWSVEHLTVTQTAPEDAYYIIIVATGNADGNMSATITLPIYDIIASAGTGGTISPSGTTTVDEGTSQTYTISANIGYGIKDILVDGVSQGAITSYTFANVNSNHTIEVVFESVPTVIAAIKNNVFYAINVFEGYSEFSIGPDGVYLNKISKDLNENESIYLDSNYTLHVFNFIKEDL